MTRLPLARDSATFSAASRHTEQRRNSVSPSIHSLDCRSNVRGVEATVKLATAAPEGVNRSSGSAVRLPTTVMTVSPAMSVSSGVRWGSDGSVSVRTDELGAQDGLVEAELAVELLGELRRRRHVDDGVDALGTLLDVEGKTTLTPDVDLVDLAALGLDDREELVERRGDRTLVDLRVEDDHQFVLAHAGTH